MTIHPPCLQIDKTSLCHSKVAPHLCNISLAVRALSPPFRGLCGKGLRMITGTQKYQPLIQLFPLFVLLFLLMVFVLYSAGMAGMFEFC